ncbi:outer membrane protein [Leminorella grimontii]|uniref:Outer membrane protein n=1 Tax=Leminorella grimontii TaxID=82981 RepID=A0AAV5N1Q8_9GAMM|nr:YgiW/YdeI family stress tolerance OB fold protein [Leminorella grimontii]KFC96199.1 YgiW family protein [Leminorella grimontii ATCC 33999 = DSM 5078]GKX54612.1 outer membrane protein [Leminorella grimontii]VFS58818.1 Uncharacterized conserved protein [Leminorella grimontii]
MKKLTMLALVTALISTPLLAQSTGGFNGPNSSTAQTAPAGGFSGPKASATTVDKALKMSDDAWVTLRGNIVQQIGKELYLFRDETGTMNVDIDDKRWQGQVVTPDDLVELQGEIDKDWNSIELDVKRVIKVNK